jgi:hypothetical protein
MKPQSGNPCFPFPTPYSPTFVIQIAVSTESPHNGVHSHETNQLDRFFCAIARPYVKISRNVSCLQFQRRSWAQFSGQKPPPRMNAKIPSFPG